MSFLNDNAPDRIQVEYEISNVDNGRGRNAYAGVFGFEYKDRDLDGISYFCDTYLLETPERKMASEMANALKDIAKASDADTCKTLAAEVLKQLDT